MIYVLSLYESPESIDKGFQNKQRGVRRHGSFQKSFFCCVLNPFLSEKASHKYKEISTEK